MKIRVVTFIGALVAAVGTGALMQAAWSAAADSPLKWTWSDKLEAVNAAPSIHKVLFENGHIRLLEVTIHAGEKEPMHGHAYPSVFAFDAPQPALDNEQLDGTIGKVPRSANSPGEQTGCRTMGVQAPHSVRITDSFQQHFYRLEFKHVDGNDILGKR